MNREAKQQGFTIIELTLAMTFVSVLMVAIAMTITQLANIYNKGTTLRAVDQAGRAISRDIQTTLAEAQPLDIDSDGDEGANLRSQVQVGGDVTKPDGGRLCTGSYSYIWNTGRLLASETDNDQASGEEVNKYETSTERIRLVKVRDTGAIYCSDTSLDIKKEDATELLSSGDRRLAIQSLSITAAAVDAVTQQALYRIQLEIGTNDENSLCQPVGGDTSCLADQQTEINTIDTRCKPPSDDDSRRDFCAVNKFEFTVRAGNRGNS